MSMLILTGENANAITLAIAAPTSTNVDSNFPISNLYDGRPGQPFRFASYVSTLDINMDLNRIVDSSSAYTLGVGSTYAAGVGRNLPGIESYQDITARSGETINYTVRMRAYAGSLGASSKLSIVDMATGKYWDGVSAWTYTPTFAANAAGSGATTVYTGAVPLEGYSRSLVDLTTVRFIFTGFGPGGTGGEWLEFAAFPSISLMSIHGHNLTPWSTTVRLFSSADNSVFNTRIAAASVTRSAFYGSFSAVGERYWRARFQASNTAVTPTVGDAIPSIGELILGDPQTISYSPVHPSISPWRVDYIYPQIRNELQGGYSSVTRLVTNPLRMLQLDMLAVSDSEHEEIYRDLVERSGQGTWPTLIVPDNAEPMVIYGRLADGYKAERTHSGTHNRHESQIAIKEFPGPAYGA
jgi:hypothetical protein